MFVLQYHFVIVLGILVDILNEHFYLTTSEKAVK